MPLMQEVTSQDSGQFADDIRNFSQGNSDDAEMSHPWKIRIYRVFGTVGIGKSHFIRGIYNELAGDDKFWKKIEPDQDEDTVTSLQGRPEREPTTAPKFLWVSTGDEKFRTDPELFRSQITQLSHACTSARDTADKKEQLGKDIFNLAVSHLPGVSRVTQVGEVGRIVRDVIEIFIKPRFRLNTKKGRESDAFAMLEETSDNRGYEPQRRAIHEVLQKQPATSLVLLVALKSAESREILNALDDITGLRLQNSDETRKYYSRKWRVVVIIECGHDESEEDALLTHIHKKLPQDVVRDIKIVGATSDQLSCCDAVSALESKVAEKGCKPTFIEQVKNGDNANWRHVKRSLKALKLKGSSLCDAIKTLPQSLEDDPDYFLESIFYPASDETKEDLIDWAISDGEASKTIYNKSVKNMLSPELRANPAAEDKCKGIIKEKCVPEYENLTELVKVKKQRSESERLDRLRTGKKLTVHELQLVREQLPDIQNTNSDGNRFDALHWVANYLRFQTTPPPEIPYVDRDTISKAIFTDRHRGLFRAAIFTVAEINSKEWPLQTKLSILSDSWPNQDAAYYASVFKRDDFLTRLPWKRLMKRGDYDQIFWNNEYEWLRSQRINLVKRHRNYHLSCAIEWTRLFVTHVGQKRRTNFVTPEKLLRKWEITRGVSASNRELASEELAVRDRFRAAGLWDGLEPFELALIRLPE